MFWKILLLACAPVGAFQPTGTSSRPVTSLNAVDSFLDRRQALKSTVAGALSLLLLAQPAKAENPQTIVITGANSGIGFEAAKKLAERGHTLVLACRTIEKAKDTVQRIESESSSGTLIPAECDLASLDSIKTFVNNLKVDKIDVLCLNAGLSLKASDKQVQRTADGFELTVG
jgi:hypothetical protein